MEELEKLGQKRTIIVSISVILISLYTIYISHINGADVETKKIIQQIVRFSLTIGLLFAVYYGKNWARIIMLILFSLAIVGALLALISLSTDILLKIPFFVMIFIYGMGIHHFGFSQSFKAFSKYQNNQQS